MPVKHTYSTVEDLHQARASLKRWNDEWRERKANEMEIFNGKREVNVNEGETATSVSQSRVSANNKTDTAQKLHQEAQKQQVGRNKEQRRTEGDAHVSF